MKIGRILVDGGTHRHILRRHYNMASSITGLSESGIEKSFYRILEERKGEISDSLKYEDHFS